MLTTRHQVFELPAYSVSSDLLAFQECGLRYRYQHRGKLPPSRLVEQWAGSFLHGVIEAAFRRWRLTGEPLPWDPAITEGLARLVIRQLAATGLVFRSYRMLGMALERAFLTIEEFGPALFTTIGEAETRLRAVRRLPAGTRSVRGDRFEIVGVADVVGQGLGTDLVQQLAPSWARYAGSAPGVIIDYKGMARPTQLQPTWQRHAAQIWTYAWLWERQPGAHAAGSGLLLYLNELAPDEHSMGNLHQRWTAGEALIPVDWPEADFGALTNWPEEKKEWQRRLQSWDAQVAAWEQAPPDFRVPFPRMPVPAAYPPLATRRARVIRPVRVDPAQVVRSLNEFDAVVSEIEACVAQEVDGAPVPAIWPARPEIRVCEGCDFRAHCPAAGRFRRPPLAP